MRKIRAPPTTMSIKVKTTLTTLCLLLPTLSLADSILSLDWSANDDTLIALTASDIILKTGDQVTHISGPNSSMNDGSLYANNTRFLVATANGTFTADRTLKTWQPFNEGLESTSIDFVFTNVELQNVLYAATQDTIYKYTPEDTSWVNMDIGPGGNITDYLHSNMPDSMETGWIFAATTSGVAFTADCFCFWRDVPKFDYAVTALTYQPENPSWYYAATDQGLMETKDGARTWQKLTDLPVSDTSALVTAGNDILYLGTQSGNVWQLDRQSNNWKKVY